MELSLFSKHYSKAKSLQNTYSDVAKTLYWYFGMSICKNTYYNDPALASRNYNILSKTIEFNASTGTQQDEIVFGLTHEYIHSLQDFCISNNITPSNITNLSQAQLEQMATDFFGTPIQIQADVFKSFIQCSPFFAPDVYPILMFDETFYVSPTKTSDPLQSVILNATYFTNLTEMMANYYAGVFCSEYCAEKNIPVRYASVTLSDINEYIQDNYIWVCGDCPEIRNPQNMKHQRTNCEPIIPRILYALTEAVPNFKEHSAYHWEALKPIVQEFNNITNILRELANEVDEPQL